MISAKTESDRIRVSFFETG